MAREAYLAATSNIMAENEDIRRHCVPKGARITPASDGGGGNQKQVSMGAETGVENATAGKKRETYSATPRREKNRGTTGERDSEAVESPKHKADRRGGKKKSKLMNSFYGNAGAKGDGTPADIGVGALDEVNARGAREASAHKGDGINDADATAGVRDGEEGKGGGLFGENDSGGDDDEDWDGSEVYDEDVGSGRGARGGQKGTSGG